MPSIRRFCPAENSHATSGLNGDHRRDQIVHKSIVIGPARDPIQPGFEQSKLGVAELICQLFQQENCEDFFFENTGEQWIVWDRLKPVVEVWRAMFKNPHTFKNLEEHCTRLEAWREKRAPGTTEAMRGVMKAMREAAQASKTRTAGN